MAQADSPLLGQGVRCALLNSAGPALADVLAFATRGCA
jgi:hypothetical protein